MGSIPNNTKKPSHLRPLAKFLIGTRGALPSAAGDMSDLRVRAAVVTNPILKAWHWAESL